MYLSPKTMIGLSFSIFAAKGLDILLKKSDNSFTNCKSSITSNAGSTIEILFLIPVIIFCKGSLNDSVISLFTDTPRTNSPMGFITV